MPMADCLQMHANPGPALVAAPVDLNVRVPVAMPWPRANTTLSGLLPPPDPLPPRA
jgi:hypothetical protein